MNLKRSGDASPESQSPAPEAVSMAVAAVVEELIGSLKQQRLYREVTLALRCGLRDARAEFSFLRVRGRASRVPFLLSDASSLLASTTTSLCLPQMRLAISLT